MVVQTHRPGTPETLMDGDRILLTIPSDARFRSVATLVLGGIGSRADLPFERTDDLQLAVLSALDASAESDVTVEIDAASDGRLAVSVGPVRDGSGEDAGLLRVLSPLVDTVAAERRDGVEWLTLVVLASKPGL